MKKLVLIVDCWMFRRGCFDEVVSRSFRGCLLPARYNEIKKVHEFGTEALSQKFNNSTSHLFVDATQYFIPSHIMLTTYSPRWNRDDSTALYTNVLLI